jgi:glycosyltransferase involved in cell wall biosynthesis
VNFIDVVMTTFNEDLNLLSKSLDSIFQQKYKHFRLILVIEPNDMNAVFIDNCAQDNDRLLVVKNKKNLGFVASLNVGIKLSTAKYIARMDSDDISHPDRFRKQIDFLEKNQDVDVLGAWVTCNNSNTIRKYPEYHDNIKSNFLFSNAIAHPVVILRRELFEKYGYYDESFTYSEDFELWLRLIKGGCEFHNLQESLLVYSASKGLARNKTHWLHYYRARVRYNKALFDPISAIGSLFVFKVLLLMPKSLLFVIDGIFSKKIRNLHKE